MPSISQWSKAELIQEVKRLQQNLDATHLFNDSRIPSNEQNPLIDLKSIIESLHQPVLILDGELCLQNANHAFFETFRGQLDSIRNQLIYVLNNHQWNSPVLRELLEEMLPRQPFIKNFLFKHHFPDLGRRTLLLNVRQFLYGLDRHSLILIAVQDVTELNRMQAALEHNSLEGMRLDEELRQFALLAAHDLQEPLRMVIMYLSLIEGRMQRSLDPETRKFMNYALDGAQRMRSLIFDLLNYSRVRLGTEVERGLPMTPCDIGQIISRAMDILQGSIEESGTMITFGRMPTLVGAEPQLLQVFLNLIGNAIKFSKSGARHIHIEAIFEGDEWVFSVRDNGIGFDQKDASQIFELFHRLHSHAEYHGNGIGLAICKRVVEYHGGRIWASSQPDIGSTFFFTLPINPMKRQAKE